MSMPAPALVLIPPLGHDAVLYGALARELSSTLPVVALDYPGFGENREPFDYEGPGLLERLAQHFVHEVSQLVPTPLGLGGVSLGGTLAVRVAHGLGQRIPSLFLMGSGGLPVARIRRETVRAAMAEHGAAGFARVHLGLDGRELEASSLRQHFGELSEPVRSYHAHYVHGTWQAPHFEARARASVAMLDAALDVDYREEMAACASHAHVIWGNRDRLFGEKFVTRVSHAFPHATLHVLEGVGHYPPLEAPARVAHIVRAAMREKESP